MSGHKKTSWPELLNVPVEAAKRKILADRPDVQVVVVPEGSFVTTEFNPKRVHVFVNGDNDVAQVPRIG